MNRFKVKRKVVLLGDSAVGKTSLIRRYVLDKFDDKYITTIGTKVTKKELSIERDDATIDLTLMIWDVLGQAGYTSIQAKSYRGADGVLFVADLTRPDSLQNIEAYWLAELNKVSQDVPAVLVGNKVDLQDEIAISEGDLEKFSDNRGWSSFQSSAKTGENVEKVFVKLGEVVVKSLGPLTQPGAPGETKELTDLKDAADMIMTEFVDTYGDQEMAMAIIRTQFSKAEVDIGNPTKDALLAAVELLGEAQRDVRPAKDIVKDLMRWKAMIERLG
jgi:small GTP-binding protein